MSPYKDILSLSYLNWIVKLNSITEGALPCRRPGQHDRANGARSARVLRAFGAHVRRVPCRAIICPGMALAPMHNRFPYTRGSKRPLALALAVVLFSSCLSTGFFSKNPVGFPYGEPSGRGYEAREASFRALS